MQCPGIAGTATTLTNVCIPWANCAQYITPTNQGGGDGMNPSVWCMGAASQADVTTSVLYQSNVNNAGQPFAPDFQFGLTGVATLTGNVYQPNITNACTNDLQCLNGPQDDCCSTPWGVVLTDSGTPVTPLYIDQTCAVGNQANTGCLPCLSGQYPIPQAYMSNLGANNQVATFFACLPVLRSVSLTNSASAYDSGNTRLYYYLRNSNNACLPVISYGVITNAGSDVVQVAPGESLEIYGEADCQCLGGPVHSQNTSHYLINYGDISASQPAQVTFSGTPSCSGLSCNNGNISISCSPSICNPFTAPSC